MSHEGGPEQSQRTVAELLAKYGAESGGNQPRRRRRRADDVADTGAQQIIDRVLSESGEMQAISDDMAPPERTSHRRNAERTGNFPQPSQRLPQPGQASSQRLPRPLPPQPSSQQLPRPQPSARMPMPPPGGTRDRTGIRSRLDGDIAPPPPAPLTGPSTETTEEIPRVPGRIPVDGSMTGRRPVPNANADSPTQYAPAYDPYGDQPEDDYNAYPDADPDERYDTGEYDNVLDEDARGDLDDDDLDELDDLDDEDADRTRSPVREWLVMLAQLALGVIGGAAVWLGFNWLWGFLPAAALVAALVVIVAMVLIVRKIRRAEDLQTTVLAVLVGLVVTVSPAALLLLNR